MRCGWCAGREPGRWALGAGGWGLGFSQSARGRCCAGRRPPAGGSTPLCLNQPHTNLSAPSPPPLLRLSPLPSPLPAPSRVTRDRFFQLSWRPRPPSLLPEEAQREIGRNLKRYAKRYEEEDEALLMAADSEFLAERERMMADWRAWAATRTAWAEEHAAGVRGLLGDRCACRSSVAPPACLPETEARGQMEGVVSPARWLFRLMHRLPGLADLPRPAPCPPPLPCCRQVARRGGVHDGGGGGLGGARHQGGARQAHLMTIMVTPPSPPRSRSMPAVSRATRLYVSGRRLAACLRVLCGPRGLHRAARGLPAVDALLAVISFARWP